MTQQDVAAKGITLRYFQELERGTRNPSPQMLHELEEILDVRVADLVEVGEKKAPVNLAEVTAEPPPRGPRGRKPKRARKVPLGPS